MQRIANVVGFCLSVLLLSVPLAVGGEGGSPADAPGGAGVPGRRSLGAGGSPARDQRVEKLLSQISEQRLTGILQKLGSFGTRNTLSSSAPDRGIEAAAKWIADEMTKSSSRLKVSFDTYDVPKGGRITRDIKLTNVMAVLPGRSPRRVYVSGHYDSYAAVRPAGAPAPQAAAATGGDAAPVDNPAPGVNDDGSGTAMVMELARVFGESGIEFDATLVFIALAGEEQGLVGATKHAEKAAADKVVIDAVLNNDMIGNVQAPSGMIDSTRVRVFSEGPEDSPSRQLARYLVAAAARYVPTQQVTLLARYDRFGRGGDHTAFNQQGFTAVRITEAVENFERQHTTADTFEGMNIPYFLRNVRLDAAAMASLALAPPAPVVVNDRGAPNIGRQPSGYDANLRWKASPGAASYTVYWRQAWTPDWQHQVNVGNVTEFVFPNLSIDDYVFGVAAVGADGNESLVAAYVNPPRR